MDTKAIEKRLKKYINYSTFREFKFPEEHKLLLSEGCRIILEEGGIIWLFNMILFFQLTWINKKMPVQVWTFSKLPDGRMSLMCEDKYGEHHFADSNTTINFPFNKMRFIVHDRYMTIYEEVFHESGIDVQ